MSVSIPNASVLNRIVLVGLDVSIWSARKKLHRDELDASVKLPPEEMFSLGSKNVIDLAHLSVFETLKRRALRAIEGPGVRLMGAVGVPDTIHLEVVVELQNIQAEFNAAKQDFLNNLDRYHEEWIEKSKADPAWQAVLRASATPKAYVEKALSFDFSMCRLIPDQSAPSTTAGLERQINGLAGQLYAEVATEARKIMEFMLQKDSVTQKTVNRLKGMHGKLCSMAFVNSEVQELADYLDDRLKALPQTGKLEGRDFKDMVSLVSSLCDEDSIVGLVKAMATRAPDAVVDEFAGLNEADAEDELVDLAAAPAAPEAVEVAGPQEARDVVIQPLALDEAEIFIEQEAEAAAVDIAVVPPVEPQAPVTEISVPVPGLESDLVVDDGDIDFCL